MKMAGNFEIGMEKLDEIRKAAMSFKDAAAKHLKGMKVEVKDWRFGMDSNEKGVTIDITFKVLLKPKAKK